MKILSKILVTYVTHQCAWSTNAFYVQGPNAPPSAGNSWQTTNSYLDGLNKQGTPDKSAGSSTILKNAAVAERASVTVPGVTSSASRRTLYTNSANRNNFRSAVPPNIVVITRPSTNRPEEPEEPNPPEEPDLPESNLPPPNPNPISDYEAQYRQAQASNAPAPGTPPASNAPGYEEPQANTDPVTEGIPEPGASGGQVTQAATQDVVDETLETEKHNLLSIWENSPMVTVQGGSLRTYSSPVSTRMQVALKTEGRPLNANLDLWQGPDNTPQRMAIYLEDGHMTKFNTVIETPGEPNTVAIRNTGMIEFPLVGAVKEEIKNAVGFEPSGPATVMKALAESGPNQVIQGGALRTYPFHKSVASIQLLLQTDGRPLSARVELLQGPNTIKQVIDLYTEDGNQRPFYAILETPGFGNVIRIVNTGALEFPMIACIEPLALEDEHGNPGLGNGWDHTQDRMPRSMRNRYPY